MEPNIVRATMNKVTIVETPRPGGGKRYDIHLDDKLVEGGFFSRSAAEAAAEWWRTNAPNFTKENR